MKSDGATNRWLEEPADPDLVEDLGYDIDHWEVVRTTSTHKEHLLFLPSDEEMLREDAFIVATADSVADLMDFL